ncbi:MAG: PT domain-containing protein [Chloroflexi bacterium]|nr:PT domain-containing protein [Chloroflexota bacterium]
MLSKKLALVITLCLCYISQPANQPTSQPANQPTSQPANHNDSP